MLKSCTSITARNTGPDDSEEGTGGGLPGFKIETWETRRLIRR